MRLPAHSLRRPAGVAVLACTAALVPAAVIAATTSPQAPAAKATAARLVGCNESSGIRPTNYNPICNDGAGTVIRLQWPGWSGSAEGRGEFYTQTCVPNCASGKVQTYSVDVSAWRVRGGDYTRLRYYFPDSVPRGFSRSWTIEYYSHRWHGKVV